MLKKFTIAAALIACALALYAVEGDTSFNLNVMSVEAQPAEVPGLPPGVMMRPLHLNPRTQMNSLDRIGLPGPDSPPRTASG